MPAPWRAIACPTCGAEAGHACRSVFTTRTKPHRARVREARPLAVPERERAHG